MLKRVRAGVVMLALAAVVSGCRGTSVDATNTPDIVELDLYVTSSAMPLAADLRQAYLRSDVFFVIRLHEINWVGLEQQLIAETSAYGMTTYLPDNSDLWAAPIGEDGIAIIVHREIDQLPVLTASQLRGIFGGAITNWSELDGDNQPIYVVSYDEGAAVRLAFDRMVLGQQPVTLAAQLAPTAESMLDIVANTPGAIGYVSYGMLDSRVRVVPVAATITDEPVAPSLMTLSNGSYPLRMPILLVGQKPPETGSAIYQFFLWMQQGSGQQVIARRYLPLRGE